MIHTRDKVSSTAEPTHNRTLVFPAWAALTQARAEKQTGLELIERATISTPSIQMKGRLREEEELRILELESRHRWFKTLMEMKVSTIRRDPHPTLKWQFRTGKSQFRL
jgi:hypothetical protein